VSSYLNTIEEKKEKGLIIEQHPPAGRGNSRNAMIRSMLVFARNEKGGKRAISMFGRGGEKKEEKGGGPQVSMAQPTPSKKRTHLFRAGEGKKRNDHHT